MTVFRPLTPPLAWSPKHPTRESSSPLVTAGREASLASDFLFPEAAPKNALRQALAKLGPELSPQAWLDAVYSAFAEHAGLRTRAAQLSLAQAVCKALLGHEPLAAEAPTGTGKTLAYLLGILAARRALGRQNPQPLVVSTATKALQHQLIAHDLPQVVNAGLLQPNEVSLAKGKGNYLCLLQARQSLEILQQAQQDPELFAFHDVQDLDAAQLSDMVCAFEDNSWDGDFDHYEGLRTFEIKPVAVNADTCLKRKCEHYQQCAYTRARARLAESAVIVTNHDLLLLDLWMSAYGEGEGALPVANYRLVVDEAHHLPDKAISVGSTQLSVTHLLGSLPKLQGVAKLLQSHSSLSFALASRSVSAEVLEREPLQQALRVLVGELSKQAVDEAEGLRRFARGQMPEPVRQALRDCVGPLEALLQGITQVLYALRDTGAAAPSEALSQTLKRLTDVKTPLEEGLRCVRAFIGTAQMAKWLARKGQHQSLHAAPLEGRDVLKPVLWHNKRVASTALLSATLRDFSSFSRYHHRCGLPENSKTLALPAQFDYARSELCVAAMRATPKMAERKAFLRELEAKLPEVLNPKEGTLILFPSWSMLKELTPVLQEHLYGRASLRVQGAVPIKQLLRGHCAAIDAGEGSVLAGVATLSEGLDLPGDYCRHVVIVALPFAAPTDPVEQELSDLLGSRYFSERSLPDAMVRLTQMVGRLIRREDDSGRITVLDRRLAATSYGRQMLAALPAFKKTVEPLPA